MHKQKYIITIPQPCHEKWEEMSPVEQRRFCEQCQKKVIDFSCKNDAQVVQVFNANKGKPLCGRYLNTQLNQEITTPLPVGSFGAVFFKRIVASVLLMQSLMPFSLAQTSKPQKQHLTAISDLGRNVKHWKRGVRGYVTDVVTGKPLSAILVKVTGTEISAVTGPRGNFFIPLPDSFSQSILKISATYMNSSNDRVPGKIILDVEVPLTEALVKKVNLFRYPVEQLPEVSESDYRRPPLIDNETELPGGVYQVKKNEFRNQKAQTISTEIFKLPMTSDNSHIKPHSRGLFLKWFKNKHSSNE